jgi:hypothetical protein
MPFAVSAAVLVVFEAVNLEANIRCQLRLEPRDLSRQLRVGLREAGNSSLLAGRRLASHTQHSLVAVAPPAPQCHLRARGIFAKGGVVARDNFRIAPHRSRFLVHRYILSPQSVTLGLRGGFGLGGNGLLGVLLGALGNARFQAGDNPIHRFRR